MMFISLHEILFISNLCDNIFITLTIKTVHNLYSFVLINSLVIYNSTFITLLKKAVHKVYFIMLNSFY